MYNSYASQFSQGRDTRQLIPTLKDVGMLAVLSCITGAVLGLAVASVLAALDHPQPLKAGAVTWTLIQALTWLLLLLRWSRLLGVIEQALNIDLDQNGVIGDPGAEDQPDQQTVRVEVIEDQGRRGVFADLPASQDQLKALAAGVIQQGLTLSDANWTGRGKTFDRPTFTALKGEMLKRGLAAWNSPGTPARGLALTRSGQAVFKYLLTADFPTLSGQTDLDQV